MHRVATLYRTQPMRMRLLALLFILPTISLSAQWHLSLTHGSATAAGYSRNGSTSEELAFLPDRPSNTAIAFGHDLGRSRLSLELRRTDADLALEGTTTIIVTRGAVHAWGAALEMMHRLAGRAGSPSLHGGVAFLMERWDFDVGGSDPRTRLSGRAALEAAVPISGRYSGLLRGEVAAGGSLFKPAELPEGYTTRLARRVGLQLGIMRSW